MNKRYIFSVLLFFVICYMHHAEGQTAMSAQSFDLSLSDHPYLNGYAESVSGQTIEYHSPLPEISTALLVRATSGEMTIEWNTEPVQYKDSSDRVRFIWLAGLGCNVGEKPFDFYANGRFRLTFKSLNEEKWSIQGDKNAELSFETMIIDRNGDRFGIMILSVPKTDVREGEALRLKVTGQNASSSAWVMTFQKQLSEKITLLPNRALLRGEEQSRQPLTMDIVYFGKPVLAEVQVDREPARTLELNKMFSRFTISVPEVQTEKEIGLKVRIGSREVFNQPVAIAPVRKFTVYLVQHSHTDIGYTRPQTDILSEHLRYIDYALDYCDQTDDYPDEARFRWTCEASWPVREYVQNRPPEQIERLKKRVQEGRIELTGMMFNMSEITDENSFTDFIQAVGDFRNAGMPVKTAMQNDVNGFAWCLVDYFQDTGVEYLSMGTHGHKALIAFDRPTPFWMESPSGNRLLAFRADHYMTANFWGIHGESISSFEPSFFKYLENLFEKGYPYDKIAVQHSGYFTDNSPPGLASCEMIRKWNETYEWPKLRSAVARDFLDAVREQYSDELPVFRAAWPDWWTDGFGSAARETAASRETHAEMSANLGLLSMAMLSGAELPEGIRNKIQIIQDALLFYDEHTYGAAESISDPMAENTQIQWSEKSAYVWDAVKNSRLLTEVGMGLMQPFLSRKDVPTLTVFNTLNWMRSGLLNVYIDNEIIPKEKKFSIVDESGDHVTAQIVSSRNEGNFWALWLEGIPALGYKTYRIEISNEKRNDDPPFALTGDVLENAFYKLRINREKGTVSSLYDKELKQECTDSGGEWQLGQFIYEKTGYRGQLDRFTLEQCERQAMTGISIEEGIDGPIWQSIRIMGNSEGFDPEKGITLEIRLFKKEKRIEFWYAVRKLEVQEPEGVYVAFPFSMPDAVLQYEVQGGLVQPGKDQIPGSSSDWNTFQNFITIGSEKGQIVWGSDAMPLVHLGGINLGKFQYIAQVEKPHVFSWPMNNIWVTNFRVSQEGDLNWSYYFTSSKDRSATFASQFGWASRMPFLARVLPAGPEGTNVMQQSFIKPLHPNLLLVAARPSKDNSGIILHFRELEGKKTSIAVNELLNGSRVKQYIEVNALQEERRKIDTSVTIEPYGVLFIKATL